MFCCLVNFSNRDEVRRFETKTRKFYSNLEEGVEVTLWQMNHNSETNQKEDFVLKAAPITMKLHKRGEMLLQAVLTFNSRGGYFSKALGRGKSTGETSSRFTCYGNFC